MDGIKKSGTATSGPIYWRRGHGDLLSAIEKSTQTILLKIGQRLKVRAVDLEKPKQVYREQKALI
jgi:hypothetical protein